MSNYTVWLDMFKRTMSEGIVVAPRGFKIREIQDLQITIDPMRPFMNFEHRKLNISYFKKEMLWKLRADPYDDSIKQHAAMWDSVQNSDGTFDSNYGQYWFGKQLGWQKAVNELIRDVDSRRAIIPMLNDSHIGPQVRDTVCTEAIGFRIRDNALYMSVHMRSSDQIFGLGTDIPTFAFLYRMTLAALARYYNLNTGGTMTITAMSSHIYDRHWPMVEKIIEDPRVSDCSRMPLMLSDEAQKLASSGGVVHSSWGEASKWLLQDW